MYKALSKVIVCLIVVVAFCGQTIAMHTAMPCETVPDAHSSIDNNQITKQNNASSISQDKQSTDSTDDCCDIECCALGCLCTANGCTSIAYINNQTNNAGAVVYKQSVFILSSKQTKSFSNLPYRPPIFTS